MISRSLRLLPLVFLTSTSGLYAQGTAVNDAPPVDINRLLHELKQIQEKNTSSVDKRRQQIQQEFSGAAASGSRAIDAYEKAIRATQFAGQTLQQTQFQEWKKKEAEKLRSNEMQTAAQLHLQYLSIALQHSWGKPTEELLPALFQYTQQVASLLDDRVKRPAYQSQDLLRRSLSESVFVRWFNIQSELPPAKEWELVPLNIDGIYEKTILPVMRKKSDPNIVRYWDARIQREAKWVEDDKRTFELEQFNFVKKPNLLWRRAEDILAIGQKNRAIGEMFTIIRTYPEHPETAARIEVLQKLLPQPAAPAPAASAPSETAPSNEEAVAQGK